jgi:hypothetical protein
MTDALKIWKPGTDLSQLLSSQGDVTTFGGLSEIRYFVDYLGAIPINGISQLQPGDRLLLNNSNASYDAEVSALKGMGIIIFQMVSDLNLMYSEDLIGPHTVLSQVPSQNNDFGVYAGMEQAVTLYQKPHYDGEKRHKVVYGGGKRSGNRDEEYDRYLDLEASYLSLVISSSSKFPKDHPKVLDRMSCNELQGLYAQAKYGIVISDPSYYEKGMLTQRYWEYCLNGMVAFIADGYDRYHHLSPEDDFRRVKGPDELSEKVSQLEGDDRLRLELLEYQKQQVLNAQDFMQKENIQRLTQLLGQ